MQCSINLVQCSINLVQCSINLVLCSINLVQCSINLVQCSINLVQCSINLVLCSINLVQCSINLVQCSINYYYHQMFFIKCLKSCWQITKYERKLFKTKKIWRRHFHLPDVMGCVQRDTISLQRSRFRVISWLASIIIITLFENVNFFHARLESDVFPSVDN